MSVHNNKMVEACLTFLSQQVIKITSIAASKFSKEVAKKAATAGVEKCLERKLLARVLQTKL